MNWYTTRLPEIYPFYVIKWNMGIIPVHSRNDIVVRLIQEGIETNDNFDSMMSAREFSIYIPDGEKHLIKARKI